MGTYTCVTYTYRTGAFTGHDYNLCLLEYLAVKQAKKRKVFAHINYFELILVVNLALTPIKAIQCITVRV